VRVAVIGAGVAGLVAGRRLALGGHAVDVYERWPGLGGQASTFHPDGGREPLERYYHHLFTSDRHIAALYEELGMADAIEWHPSSVAFFAHGALHPFTTPLDLLRFSPLSLAARVRLGVVVLALQRFAPDPAPFERRTARRWIERVMGRQVWQELWGPLMRGKFGDRAEDVAMVWLWSKLRLRRSVSGDEAREERLGYPRGSWEPLLRALRAGIEDAGGAVHVDRPVARIERADGRLRVVPAAPGAWRTGVDPHGFPVEASARTYDRVLATVPSDVFLGLLDPGLAAELGEDYLARVRGVEYMAALCLLLEVDRPFSPYYWTNVADPALPFVGVIEHANLLDPARYDGRRFLYVANYLPREHPLLGLSAPEVLAEYMDGLQRINPAFDGTWVRRAWAFQEAAAQPVVTVGYGARIPPLRTPAAGLLLSNTTQIYPEDRGTNYAVRLGEEAAAAVAG
jgi:protoporphyrinogen oxidase